MGREGVRETEVKGEGGREEGTEERERGVGEEGGLPGNTHRTP